MVWRQLYLREWMDFRRLTAEALAEKTGLSEGLISQLLGGTSGGSADSIQRIAAALDCKVGDLFDIKPEPGGRIVRFWIAEEDMSFFEQMVTARAQIRNRG